MTWDHPDLEAIAGLVKQRTGLNFSASQRERAEVGIRRAFQRSGVSSLQLYREQIGRDSSTLDDLVSELTVGETYFFREPAHFEFIRREVFPALATRPGQPLRIWSAGCASGEEAFSLAILLEQQGLAERAQLLATDISRATLTRTRQPSFSSWSLRGDNEWAALAHRYLTRVGDRYLLADTIRQRVTFAYQNLVLDPCPSFAAGVWGMDLILCRNVLIYFDRETVQTVAHRLFQALAPGAWLITASSDPPIQDSAPFEVAVRESGVFYRRPKGEGEAPAEPILSAVFSSAGASPSRNRLIEEPATPMQRVRALANQDAALAERACAAETERQPLALELHYLHAILLIDLGRDEAALHALRRVLYLDRTLAVAHFTLGALLWRRGDLEGARRAFRIVGDLCAACPADEVMSLSDGEPAGRLAQAAAFQLQLLDCVPERKQ
jgi:chemotaxis protein methyltransferase CheR